jgi:hypothetical protein
MKLKALAAALIIATAAAGTASAHHSFPATYHVDQTVEVSGTVVQFLFRNPHSFIHVLVKDKSGKQLRYAVEWGGGAALARDGRITSTTLKPGDKVVLSGNPARASEDLRIRLQKSTRPADGWEWGGTFQ